MKKISALVYVITASLFSGSILANEPGKSDTGLDYNYLGVDYASYTISSASGKGVSGYAGYKVNGSALVSQNIYLLANYFNVDKSSTVYEKSNIGLGYRMPIAANADFFTSLAYYSQTKEQSTSPTKKTNAGYNLSLGARAKISSDADITGAYSYISADSYSYNNFNLSIKYNLTDAIYASGGYQSQTGSSSLSGYTLGLGLKF
ncbi:MAG: hypothetical protein ACKO5X_08305 [Limnohabitans sp.]